MMSGRFWTTLVLASLTAGIGRSERTVSERTGEQAGTQGRFFLGIKSLAGWQSAPGNRPGETTWTSPPLETPLVWNELILSWNVHLPANTGIRLEARGVYTDHTTKYYVMGLWSADPAQAPRESVVGQKDAEGTVDTDTLVLNQPCRQVQVRLVLPAGMEPSAVKFLGLSFLDSRHKLSPLPPYRAAWGKTLEVPQRAQGAYPGGAVYCSPTSTSMVLAYWARNLKRPELDHDVPDVVKGVFDPKWPGTGNWPFNTAFAGSLPGLRAYVTRLADVAEIEAWIAAGVPVIFSVDYGVLLGKRDSKLGGHLIVCVGFTNEGDVVVNDPALNPAHGKSVRHVYTRASVIAGWNKSHNTVYLLYPEETAVPSNASGHWDGK
jgi:hypothetical protein